MGWMRITRRTLMELSSLWKRGFSAKRIADTAGISYDALWHHVRNHRDLFPPRKHHAGWWAETLAETEGMSAKDVADLLGCTPATVHSWRKRLSDER